MWDMHYASVFYSGLFTRIFVDTQIHSNVIQCMDDFST